MTAVTMDGRPGPALDHDIPDDLFASLPDLPSLDGFEARLRDVQTALDLARSEGAAIRNEIRRQAETLRKLAAALESV